MPVFRIVLAVVGLTVLAWLLPASVGGGTSYVITHGISMEPGFHTGDLAIVREADMYRVGDVVAYKSEQMNTVVMHRIIAFDGDRYLFKGDNNSFIDVDHPAAADFLGRLAVRIPEGGTWLQRLGSPFGLAVVAFTLLAGGGAATTRHQRKRRRASMSRHISTRPSTHQGLGGLPPSLRIPAAIGTVLAALGVGLGGLAWSGPLDETATSQVKSGTRTDFSYTAAVGQSAAYDGTTAQSPDPVFRKLANTVDVGFSYHGEPGTVTVTAELSTPGGWHSTVPLTGPAAFEGNEYEATVRLDLATFEAKAQAASAVTGLPSGPISIGLAPAVKTTSGADFRPELKLNLTPLQLTLAGGPGALSVTDSATQEHTAMAPRMVGINGLAVTAAVARVISAVFLLAALATGIIILIFARRTTPGDEAAAIRRRYAALLVRVHPMPAPPGRPVIDVTTFPTLAKLAERYGLLVLHWSRSGVETFVVQDENITYRYRAGSEHAPAESQTESAQAQA